MSCIDDEILKGAESDAEEVQFIKNYMGSECEDNFSEEDLYYCLDVMLEFFEKANSAADADGFIDIDTEEVAKFIQKKAKKEGRTIRSRCLNTSYRSRTGIQRVA